MGCQCSGGSQIEQFLTEFVEELKIRKFTDQKFVETVERYNPFSETDKVLYEILSPNHKINLEEHRKYAEDLLTQPRQFLCISMLLLTITNAKSLSSHYLTIVDRLKNKYSEATSKKLDGLYESDFEVLKKSLLFYCRMISYDIVDACLKCNKFKMSKDQFEILKSMYSSPVIEFYVNELLKNYVKNGLNHEEFFKNNIQNLNHPIVRDRLRLIWSAKFATAYQKVTPVIPPVIPPVASSGKIYTLNNNVELENEKKEKPVLSIPLPVINPTSTPVSLPLNFITPNPTPTPILDIPLVSSGYSSSKAREVDDYTKNLNFAIPSINFHDNKTSNDLITLSNQNITPMNNYLSSFPTSFSLNDKPVSLTNNITPLSFSTNDHLSFSNLTSSAYKPVNGTTFDIGGTPFLLSNGNKEIASTNSTFNPDNFRPTFDITSALNSMYSDKNNDNFKNLTNNIDLKDTNLNSMFRQFKEECLAFHNEKRRLHKVPLLEEDYSLTQKAQDWANKLAESDQLSHSNSLWNGNLVGENIAKACAILDSPAKPICSKWYNEISNYNFTYPGSQNNTKNFTQMVWKNSRQAGFGLAFSKTGNTYVVVNYYPAGNISHEMNQNVFPASY